MRAPGPWWPRPAAGGVLARDTAVLSLGLALSQGLMLAVMPLWSRIYSPTDFAALGLWGAVVSVVSLLLLMRYDTCIVIARSDEEARALLRLTLWLSLGGGGVLAALAAMLPLPWLAAAGLAPLGPWLPLAVLAGALASAFAAGYAWGNRRRDYVRMSTARVALTAAAVGLGTWLGSLGVPAGLLLAHAAAALLGVLALRWSLAPASDVRQAARAHLDAPRYLWPSSMLDVVTQQIPLWLTALWFGHEMAGQFSLAWRVTALPLLMLAGAAGSVCYQGLAALAHSRAGAPDAVALRALLWRTWWRFALLGLLPALPLLAFGGPLFAWAFGDTWRPAGWLAAVLMPMLWAMLISSPTSGALMVLGLQRWAPVFGLAMLVYRPAAFAVGAWAGSLPLALALWVGCEIVAIVLYNALLLRTLRAMQRDV